jgi:hypothetical protein
MNSIVNRRTFLRGGGVALALPLLDSLWKSECRGAEGSLPKRMVFICASLGLHTPFLVPAEKGRDYALTPYLELIKDHRQDFSVLSGVSHPDQSGADGHTSEQTWLTSARHPGLGGFRNTISVDQLIAERIGFETRFPSLSLGTNGTSQSYTRSGVMIPAEYSPARMFAKLFLDGSKDEIARQIADLRQGRSIMDAVQQQAKQFEKQVGAGDRAKLDEYFTSVREMEVRLAKAEEWINKPKPKVEEKQPQDVADEKDTIARMRLLFDLVPLAIQTDSTRVITILVQGRNDVPPVPGVSIDHHNLSHHGQDENKIKQLKLIEEAEFKAFGDLLAAMKAKKEAGGSVLDSTMVLLGSNLGNANSHDTRNLPLVLAGGGFKHGQHLALDQKNNVPLSNLFVQMLNRFGIEDETFGTSTSTSLPGLA